VIKQEFKDIPICTGGFYIAARYKDMLAETHDFDYAIAGEQEVTFTELCKELSKDDPDVSAVKCLAYRDNGAVKVTDYRPLIENLDDLPMPAYDLFPMDKYIGYGKLYPYQEIFTSRGCPYGCSICIDWITVDPRGDNDWLRHRTKSASRVVDEMELLEKKYGVVHVNIWDLNYAVKRSRVEQFVEEKLKRGLEATYCFLGRANTLARDKDLLKDLRLSGFINGVFGLEVANEATLKKIKKRITVDQVQEVVGRMSGVTWMIGFPDEDEKAIRDRFAALDRIDPDVQSLQVMLPVSGIPIYDEAAPFIEEHEFNKWDFHHPVVRTKHLSPQELGELALQVNQEFYTKRNRVGRLLESKVLHPNAIAVFASYMESMQKYQKASVEGELII